MSFKQPTMTCPRCGKVEDDFDGVGVVYCAPPDGCGFCRHMARSGCPTNGWRCDFCGEVEPPAPPAPPSAHPPVTVFVCGGRRVPRLAPKVPRGQEVLLLVDAMPRPKKPPTRRT